jgi:hypothetical protein
MLLAGVVSRLRHMAALAALRWLRWLRCASSLPSSCQGCCCPLLLLAVNEHALEHG